MLYRSTRGGAPTVTASEALIRGIAPDGGLYVPDSIPAFAPGELEQLAGLAYTDAAQAVLRRFFGGFGAGALERIVDRAWGAGTRFGGEGVAPLVKAGTAYLLELWHGPTCAFKDVALQFLPGAIGEARRQLGAAEKTLVLVATSGDTGKAALEGFRDAPGTHCAVFYPLDGVSEAQKLQMQTQRGSNVTVIGVRGNFDDAQTGVKRLFADHEYTAALKRKGWAPSSANSINWGRLAPQIAYYVSAWCGLYASGAIREGDPVDFAVPTGNFGNILAAWYARAMGLPVGRLICASNRNRVLTDFFATGVYDTRREFHPTISPSMDILISSNLERLLYEISDRDGGSVLSLMTSLRETGAYTVTENMRSKMGSIYMAGSADDTETAKTIREVYENTGYLLDPHTAVAWKVWRDLGTERPTVVVATASPYKFAGDVVTALKGEPTRGGREDGERLFTLTGVEPPQPIREIWDMPVLHDRVCEVSGMGDALLEALDR